MKLVLASASPRRAALLSEMQLAFSIRAPEAPEVYPDNLPPWEAVQVLAWDKARRVLEREPDALILGADTVVVLDGKVFGKPRDEAEAVQFLRALSGKIHEVYTGVCLCSAQKECTGFERTEVVFASLSNAEIYDYINRWQPFDKAGAYGIQDAGRLFVKEIGGDFFNVVGLPLFLVNALLKQEFSMNLEAFSKRKDGGS